MFTLRIGSPVFELSTRPSIAPSLAGSGWQKATEFTIHIAIQMKRISTF